MKCPHCDYERDTAFAFCPMCGMPSTRDTEPIVICPTPRILSFVKDDLFFIMCILLTAAVGFSMLSGGFNVIALLITIFAWLTYAGGRKNIVEHGYIRVISGSVYAAYVINNILAIITAIGGILYTAAIFIGPIFGALSAEEFITEKIGPMLAVEYTLLALLSAVAMFFGGFLIILAIIILIFNVCGRKKIHRFIQSIYKSAEAGEENIIGATRIKPWLIIFSAPLKW